MKSILFQRIITGSILAIIFIALFALFPPVVTTLFLVGCLAWILVYEWPKIAIPLGIKAGLLTLLYPVYPFILLIKMNQQNRMLLFLMCLLVFSCDIGCYVFGKLFGKHLLAPSISPNKTWEGFFGGVLTTIVVLFIILHIPYAPFPLSYSIILGIPTALLAIAGDLFESWLKRKASIKDTGAILPGHGGLLDRFDSLLFVTPFFYFIAS